MMGKPAKRGSLKLVRMIAAQGRSSFGAAGFVMGLALLGAGGVLLFVPLIKGGDSPRGHDLALGLVGCAGISVGVLLLINATLCRMAHELVSYFDEIGKEPSTGASDPEHLGNKPASDDGGPSESLSGESWLQGLSTSDLSMGWRLLIIAPLVMGTAMLLLTLSVWVVPGLGNGVARALPLEFIALIALILLMTSAYLFVLAGAVARRADNKHQKS